LLIFQLDFCECPRPHGIDAYGFSHKYMHIGADFDLNRQRHI